MCYFLSVKVIIKRVFARNFFSFANCLHLYSLLNSVFFYSFSLFFSRLRMRCWCLTNKLTVIEVRIFFWCERIHLEYLKWKIQEFQKFIVESSSFTLYHSKWITFQTNIFITNCLPWKFSFIRQMIADFLVDWIAELFHDWNFPSN